MRCYRVTINHIDWERAQRESKSLHKEPRELVEEDINGDIQSCEEGLGEITVHQFQVEYSDPELPQNGTITMLYSFDCSEEDAS
jgi:hypothetical protein